MTSGAQIRESAFHNIDHIIDGEDYVDRVIKIEIHGDTVKEINQVATVAGLTSAQWIRVAILTQLSSEQDRIESTLPW